MILAIIVALLGYPLGLILAKITKEELKTGKKWFRLIIAVCVIAIVVSVIFTGGKTFLFLILSFVFIILVTLPSLIKKEKQKKKKKKKKK